MTTHARTPGSIVGCRIGRGLMRREVPRSAWLCLAGLIVALAVWGCSGGTATVSPRPSLTSTSSLSRTPTQSPTPGAFSSTGSMTTVRNRHTATLLSDGRVLIAGGDNGRGGVGVGVVASAELYDPKTGAFSATASMATGRDLHTATLLSDGRVLIAGGDIRGSTAASAELYDPKTGAFSATA